MLKLERSENRSRSRESRPHTRCEPSLYAVFSDGMPGMSLLFVHNYSAVHFVITRAKRALCVYVGDYKLPNLHVVTLYRPATTYALQSSYCSNFDRDRYVTSRISLAMKIIIS